MLAAATCTLLESALGGAATGPGKASLR